MVQTAFEQGGETVKALLVQQAGVLALLRVVEAEQRMYAECRFRDVQNRGQGRRIGEVDELELELECTEQTMRWYPRALVAALRICGFDPGPRFFSSERFMSDLAELCDDATWALISKKLAELAGSEAGTEAEVAGRTSLLQEGKSGAREEPGSVSQTVPSRGPGGGGATTVGPREGRAWARGRSGFISFSEAMEKYSLQSSWLDYRCVNAVNDKVQFYKDDGQNKRFVHEGELVAFLDKKRRVPDQA